MRAATIIWYYVILAMVVVTSLIFVDFSDLQRTVQLILILALVLLIANPILMVWISGGGENRLRQIFGSADVELQNLNAELETQVTKLMQETDHLQEVDKNKSEFVSMTAHQLRTPLSAIKWTFHMIMNGDLGPVTTDQRSFLEKGYESSEKVISVVNDWLNLDYLEANKKKYQFVFTDICELIDGVVFEFNPRTREKNLALVVERPKSNIPLVEVDPIKFSMIMENLIDNAVKYTPNNGKITITVNDDKINGREPAVEVGVADSGIGIPKAEQERLFQQFFRSSNVAATTPRGSGLGLFIVKNLVEGHGGTVHFESEEGKGTKFIITIPLKQKKV
jgi:signal transduction histidine kinase